MGYMNALSMTTTDLSIQDQVGWHLQYNHYPPIPSSMVDPCVDAIEAASAQEWDQEINLPEGVDFKGSSTAPACQIVEAHHLEPWIQEEEE